MYGQRKGFYTVNWLKIINEIIYKVFTVKINYTTIHNNL